MTRPGRDGLRLALFDCDGTLVDSQHAIAAAMDAAHRACGLPEPDPIVVRRLVGLPLPDAMALLLPDGSPDHHALLVERYREAFRAGRIAGHAEPLYPGMKDVLDELEECGVLLGIATGKSRRGLLATLDRHGLLGRFATLQTADTGPGKPHPDMVLRAVAESGADIGATVMIGDTTYDMMMARSAGAQGVGVAWGYHEPAELAAAGAAAVCHDPAALPGMVTGRPGPAEGRMGTRK